MANTINGLTFDPNNPQSMVAAATGNRAYQAASYDPTSASHPAPAPYYDPNSQPGNPFGGYRNFGQNFDYRQLYPELPGAQGFQVGRQGAYGEALQNPAAQGKLFQDFYSQAANAYAAPALRDFSRQLADAAGSTAARFGGNASTEEQRNVYNTSDLFSRNLTEGLAKLAPQAASQGLQYTSMLGSAYDAATTNRDRLSALIMQGFQPVSADPNGQHGNSLLAGIGGGIGALIGAGAGPAGMAAGITAGSQAGSQIGAGLGS